MTDVLRQDRTIAEDETVDSVEVEQIAVGTGFLSDVFRLRIGGAGPDSLILKPPPANDLFRNIGEAGDVYQRESDFYRHIAPRSPLATPAAHFIAAEGGPGVLLLEDLGRFEAGDHIAGLSWNRTLLVLEQLAAHHVIGDRFSTTDSLLATVPSRFETMAPIVTAGWDVYLGVCRREPGAGVQALIDTMPERLPELAASLASPQCLLHGDLRVDNLFFDGDRVVVVDHQYPLLGSGLVDVAYLTSQGMDPGIRGGRNRQLVDHYLDALASAGLTVSRDDGWQQYRDAVLLNCTFPLGAIFGWAALGPRAQELLLTLIERWIVAVQELALVD